MEAVTATGLVKRFEATTAVDELDLTVQAGQVHGLLGANGAGKTTLRCRLPFGLIAPDAGAILLLGPGAGGSRIGGALDHVAGFVEEPTFILTRRAGAVTWGCWPSSTAGRGSQ